MQLKLVSECLYRSHQGVYFALIKVRGKQIKRSLDTKDLTLAKRLLRDFKNNASRLVLEREKTLFSNAADQWLAHVSPTLKPKSIARRLTSINGLKPIFGSRPVRQITHGDIREWMRKRGGKLSARSYNLEIETLRLILDYCRDDLRIILEHPAERLTRKKPSKRKAVIPTKEQFVTLLKEMRSPASQNKSHDAADLVEGLAYSGCRLNEATEILWPHVNWERETLRITGGELGTKNHEDREIPLFDPLKRLLKAMRNRETSAETDHVFLIKSAKKAISSACQRAKLPHFTHHHFRHFFCSNAIEAGVDFKAIAEWLGHKDGGILVAKTYGHLRDDHSRAMARRITFDATA